MMSIKKEDQIIKAVITCLSRKPGASLEDIAYNAEISRTTLFRYFPSREKLFEKVVLELDNRIQTRLMPVLEEDISAIEMLKKFAEIIIHQCVQFDFLLYEPFIQQNPVNQSIIKQALKLFHDMIECLQQEGVIRKHINIYWAAKNLEMMIRAMSECIHDGDVAVNAAPQMLVDTFLNGFAIPVKED